MKRPTQSDIDRWVIDANSRPGWAEGIAQRDYCRRMLRLHGLGLDGKPDVSIAREAAATGARLPRGTVRVR